MARHFENLSLLTKDENLRPITKRDSRNVLRLTRLQMTNRKLHYLFISLLRKHAHAIYRDFFSIVKIENFIRMFLIFFLFLLKT